MGQSVSGSVSGFLISHLYQSLLLVSRGLSGVCLEDVWRVPGVWEVSGRFLEGISWVSEGCLGGVWGCVKDILPQLVK